VRPPVELLTGRVAAFDRDRGLGEVVTADHTAYPFHCIEIADGSRDIEVGLDVVFERRPKLGRLEAAGLRPR
jgi:cold shock CspA family protein